MMNKLNAMSIKAYLAVTNFFSDLKKDERGLSGVVVAVLLILIAVLAIVMLWGSLSGWLADLWADVTGSSDVIQGAGSFEDF